MKPKILYLSFACLIIAILISIFISRESVKIQPALEETNPQEIVTQQQSALSGQTQQLSPASYNRPAITLIKPQPKENLTPVPASEERINERQQPERLSASPSQSTVVSEEEPDESDSGITKIGKRPTEIENKEMNSRGIVMY